MRIIDGRDFDQRVNTTIRANKKHWDDKKNRLKKTHPNANILNKQIDKLNNKINKAEDEFIAGNFNRQQVASFLAGKISKENIDKFVDITLRDIIKKDSTFKDYRSKLNTFKKHVNWKGDIDFKDLNFNLFEKFRNNYLASGHHSVKSVFKSLRAIISKAYQRKVIDEKIHIDMDLFKDGIKKDKDGFQIKKDIKTATPEMILAGIDKVQTLAEWQSISFWMLMFCMRGLYQSDIASLRDAEFERGIEDETLNKWMQEKYTGYGDGLSLKHIRHKAKDLDNQILMDIRIPQTVYALLRTLKHSVIYTHYPKPSRRSLVPPLNNKSQILKYDIDADNTYHQNVWSYWSSTVKELTGVSFKTARKTFSTLASLEAPDHIVKYLIGQTTDPLLTKSYVDRKNETLLAKIHKHHQEVLEEFRYLDIMKALFKKVTSLDVPEWVYNGAWYWDITPHLSSLKDAPHLEDIDLENFGFKTGWYSDMYNAVIKEKPYKFDKPYKSYFKNNIDFNFLDFYTSQFEEEQEIYARRLAIIGAMVIQVSKQRNKSSKVIKLKTG